MVMILVGDDDTDMNYHVQLIILIVLMILPVAMIISIVNEIMDAIMNYTCVHNDDGTVD